MGADLIVAHWWTTRQPEDIDWKAGHEAIERLTLDDIDPDQFGPEFDDTDETVAIEEVKERLHADLDEMEPVWGDRHYRRDAARYVLGPVNVLLTAGMSWGDDPTDAFTLMSRMPDGVLKAMGFYA